MAFSGSGLVFTARLIAGTIDVPGIGVIGLHIDQLGNLGIGGTSAVAGPFQVKPDGTTTLASATIAGALRAGSISFGDLSMIGPGDWITLGIGSGFATPGPVQVRTSVTGADGSNSLNARTWLTDPIVGNELLAVFSWIGTATVSTITAGWVQEGATQNTSANGHSATFRRSALGGGAANDRPRLTLTAVNVISSITAEFSSTTDTSDATAVSTGTGAAPAVGPSGATTQKVDLVAVIFAQEQTLTSDAFTQPGASNYTLAQQIVTPIPIAGGTVIRSALLYRATSAIAAFSASITSPETGAYVGRLLALKATGAAGAPPPTPPTGELTIYPALAAGVSRLFYINDAGTVFGPL